MRTRTAKLGDVEQSRATEESQPQEIFTLDEAARYLKVGREAIDEAVRNRRLKVIQLCRSRRNLRIYKADLLAMRGFVR